MHRDMPETWQEPPMRYSQLVSSYAMDSTTPERALALLELRRRSLTEQLEQDPPNITELIAEVSRVRERIKQLEMDIACDSRDGEWDVRRAYEVTGLVRVLRDEQNLVGTLETQVESCRAARREPLDRLERQIAHLRLFTRPSTHEDAGAEDAGAEDGR